MDPISAISAAAAVIGYADYTMKIIGRAVELQQSPVRRSYWLVTPYQVLNALIAGFRELEALTDYFLPICKFDQRINGVFEEIVCSIAELRPIFEEVLSHSNLDVWRSPIKVLESRMKLGSMQDRLSKLSERLSDSLIKSPSGQNSVDDVQASPRFQRLDPPDKSALIALLSQCRDDSTPEEWNRYYTSAGQLLNRVLGIGAQRQSGVVMDEARDKERQIREKTHGALMALLHQGCVDERRRDIGKASEESLRWVFEEPVDRRRGGIPEWLATGSGLYLISGTEASGKSTLMSHILTNRQTKKYLEDWASPHKLVEASFFFWRNGSRLERSEDGLLRSLLHRVLEQAAHLSPILFPKEWAALYSQMASDQDLTNPGLGAWTLEQLRHAIRILVGQEVVAHGQARIKVFFAVDGIDEYRKAGGEESFGEILKFFKKDIGTSDNAKALISSRPLSEFSALDLTPQATLHQLNHDDIATYVHKVLDGDDGFQKAKRSRPADASLVTECIVRTSSGAGDFLWATLAIQIVKTELNNRKELGHIYATIHKEPPLELKDLYSILWSSIPSDAQSDATQALRMMLAGSDLALNMSKGEPGGLTLVDLTLGLGDPQVTVNLPTLPWSVSEVPVRLRCSQVANSFTTEWPHFITSISNGGTNHKNWHLDSRIRYCHRSVPEFLESVFSKEQPTLPPADPRSSRFFCPRIAHLKSAVHQLKAAPSPLPKDSWATLWAFATAALLAASAIDSSPSYKHPMYFPLLQQLDSIMQVHHIALQKDVHGRFLQTTLQDADGIIALPDGGRESRCIAKMHWSNFHFDPVRSHPRSWESSFLSLAVEFGLYRYVKMQIKQEGTPLPSKKGRPLLDYVLHPSGVAPYHLGTAKLVNLLVAHGADPNEKFGQSTCWERGLLWQYETFAVGCARAIIASGGTTDDARAVAASRAGIFRALVYRGVDRWATVVTPRGAEVTARKVVGDSFKSWTNEETHRELLELFPEDK
jgi:hypothetical protein